MSIAAWDPGAGAAIAGMLDAVDVDLERAEGILRRRTIPPVPIGPGIADQAVRHALALADDAERACASARARVADVRDACAIAFHAHDAAEQAARAAAELAGGAVATGLGTLLLGGLLLGAASLPVALPGLALAAGIAATPLGGLLQRLAARALAPLAPGLPALLNDPAFVDALALAIESADEALAGIAGIGLAQPALPLLSQARGDDEGLATGAGVALAVGLLLTGRPPRLPGMQPTRAVRAPQGPAPRPPVDGYGTAFDRLSSDGPAIEVQRYERPDGTVVWQVLARGTESFAIDDPSTAYDLTANLENAANASGRPLVGSAAAVEQALVDAGARAGDGIQLFGYSQGGAAVAAAAAHGRFDVDVVVTFGAPIGATPVPEGTTAVAVQNDSDLVSALGGTHGDGRLVLEASPDLERIQTERYDPAGQPLASVGAGGHHPEAYADTAARLDASRDDLVLDVWQQVDARLAGASATAALGFVVERGPVAP